jgi:hypothetical protein
MHVPGRATSQQRRGFTGWLLLLCSAPIVGVAAAAIYSWNLPRAVDSWRVFSIGLLLGAGAFVAGGMIGFLFAIPRSGSGNANTGGGDRGERPSYRSNSNLEEVSDWLTKILVGLGLVELGRVSSGGKRLVDFVSPAIGDLPSTKPFVAGILVIFSISGLVITYVVTRIYGGPAFARAEEDLREYVDRRIAEVEESQREQAEADVLALALAERQLEGEPEAPPVAQSELDKAVAGASPPVRVQIFGRARNRRLEGSPADTIPVFRALIASDPDRRHHRNHAQLAYALNATEPPDRAEAERELSEAIEIRDRTGVVGFPLYDYVRAVWRILLDSSFSRGEPTAEPTRALIKADLDRAARSARRRRAMETNEPIVSWLRLNPEAGNANGDPSLDA